MQRWQADDLRGKAILITGSSRALGLVMARQLLRQGAQGVICARDEERIERARRDLVPHGPGADYTLRSHQLLQFALDHAVQQR